MNKDLDNSLNALGDAISCSLKPEFVCGTLRMEIVVVVDHAVEESGGRQLLLVPGYHKLASTINRTDGIPREHL